VGYLETSLTDRIALYLWRLGRVARYERDVVAIGQESLTEEIAESRREKARVNKLCEASSPLPVFGVGDDMHPDDVISRPAQAKKDLALLEGFPKVPDAAELTPGQAMTLICAIESVGDVDIYDEDFPSFPGVPDNVTLDDFDRWIAGIVRRAWKVIATAADISLETLYAMAVTRARGVRACGAEACPHETRWWPPSTPAARGPGSGEDLPLRGPYRTRPLSRTARASAPSGRARRTRRAALSGGLESCRQEPGLKQDSAKRTHFIEDFRGHRRTRARAAPDHPRWFDRSSNE
jgi:hypothetical protein